MSISMKGGKDLAAFLQAFPAHIQKGAVRSALTAAAKPVRDQARANAPRKSGKLAKAIKTSSPKVEQDGRVTIKVQLKGQHSYLGHFIEYGVRPHFISAGDSDLSARKLTQKARREGSSEEGGVLKIGDTFVSGVVMHPGIAAKPFLRPALDARADDAVRAFGDRIRTYLKDKSGLTAPAILTEVEE
ncbi:HK97-gp10 family putative phage morphogenesis protein [Sphingobium agri]|uniref:HK97 gp10 family phage protein n=1 Tax=Sphingobium agri TaxID=2933566 RepID=A0ABT0DXE6_9SPHN|nr:HK97-gp10 family putative phage morphogenesis protein [Sphingobium agri]MCK0531770.1 HK97 gp10 family phage protein [Sphingobium agri]